jgi:hypothetical protein
MGRRCSCILEQKPQMVPQMVRSDTLHSLAASPSTGLSPHFLALYQTFIEPHKLESFDAAVNAVHLTCCRITGYGAIITITCVHQLHRSAKRGVSDTLALMLQICFFCLFELPAGACGAGGKSSSLLGMLFVQP